jgi:hypothetical protein
MWGYFITFQKKKWQNQAPQKQGAAPARSDGPNPNPEGVEVQKVQMQVIGVRMVLLISHQ